MIQDKKSQIVICFLAIYFIWGSTYMFNKVVLKELEPMILSGLRFTFASILIFIIAKLKNLPLSISKKQLLNTAILGILFITIGNGFVVFAMQYIDSGFTALLIAIQPLIMILMMRLYSGTRIAPKAIIGIALGFLGMYLLISQDEIVHHQNEWIGLSFVMISLISWSYGSLLLPKYDLPKNHFINTAYQMLVGGLLLCLGSLLSGETWLAVTQLSTKSTLSFIYLIVFGSIGAFTAYNFLLKYVSPEKVSTSTYVNPVVALFLGWWVLDEVITKQSMIAAGILLTGVYFINVNKTKMAKKNRKVKIKPI